MSAAEVSFRPLERGQLPLVKEWLDQPHIDRWWNESGSLEEVEARYGPAIDGTDPTRMLVVELDGEQIGLVQCYRQRDYPPYDEAIGIPDAVGIDYFLIEGFTGRGLGPIVLRAFVACVFDWYPDAKWCVAAPAQENRPSWRALEHAGFNRMSACQPPDEPPSWSYARSR
jgi:aminoglycoside 6'-N-acetyltransferase